MILYSVLKTICSGRKVEKIGCAAVRAICHNMGKNNSSKNFATHFFSFFNQGIVEIITFLQQASIAEAVLKLT